MEGVMKKNKPLKVLLFVLLWPAAIHGQIFGPSGRAGEYPGMSARLPGQGTDENARIAAEPLWRQALGGSVIGLPAAQVQSAVVALDSGNIKAYSSGGKPLWAYNAGGRISPYVSRSREGTCYLSRTSGIFIAVNRAGRELWRRSPGGPLSGPAVPGWDGRIFVPTGRRLSCYTNSGNLLWRREFDSPMALQPRIGGNGGLLTVLENGEFLFIDPFGGTVGCRFSTAPRTVVAVGGAGGDRALVLYPSGAAELIDPENPGGPCVLPRLPAPPLAAESRGNQAAVLMENGGVILLSGEDGSFLWTGESHIGDAGTGDTRAAMIFDERGIYVLSRSGATGFTTDGRRLWFIRLEGAAAIPAFGDDGILYSGGGDWILYAYKLEDRVRDRKQSLYGPAPEGSYGTGNPPPSPWADFYYRFDEKELDTQLDLVEKAIGEGRVGEEELAFTAYLMETAGAGTENPHGGQPPVQVRHRVRALRLLSFIGSGETVPFLSRLFSRDAEPLVRAAAAEAIGGIGLDPDGLALRSFMNFLVSPSSGGDEQVQLAVAAAAGALCRFSGPPLSDTGVKILNFLTSDSRPRMVRQQAWRELAALRP